MIVIFKIPQYQRAALDESWKNTWSLARLDVGFEIRLSKLGI